MGARPRSRTSFCEGDRLDFGSGARDLIGERVQEDRLREDLTILKRNADADLLRAIRQEAVSERIRQPLVG